MKDTLAMSPTPMTVIPDPSPWTQWLFKRRMFQVLTNAQIQQIEEHYLRRNLLHTGALLAKGGMVEYERAKFVVQNLVGLVNSPLEQQRRDVTALLGHLPQQLQNHAAQLVISAVSNVNPDIRYTATLTLGRLGQATPATNMALNKALSDSDNRVRSAAVDSLALLGQSDALAAALNHEQSDVRAAAAQALGQVNQATPAVVEALATALHSNDEIVQQAASEAIYQQGQATPELVTSLTDTLNSSDLGVRVAAARTLSHVDKTTPAVLDVLTRALFTGDRRTSEEAASALSQLGHIDTLTEALEHESAGVRVIAAHALGDIKQAQSAVLDSLTAALRDGEAMYAPLLLKHWVN